MGNDGFVVYIGRSDENFDLAPSYNPANLNNGRYELPPLCFIYRKIVTIRQLHPVIFFDGFRRVSNERALGWCLGNNEFAVRPQHRFLRMMHLSVFLFPCLCHRQLFFQRSKRRSQRNQFLHCWVRHPMLHPFIRIPIIHVCAEYLF